MEQGKSHGHLPQPTRKRVWFADETESGLSPRMDVLLVNSMSQGLLPPSPTASDDFDAPSSSSSSSITVLQADFPVSLGLKPQVPQHRAVAAVDPPHDPSSGKPSLEIVPYIARRGVHLPDPQLFTLLPKEYNPGPTLDPQVLRASALPRQVLLRESCDLPRGVRSEKSDDSQLGSVLPRANIERDQEEQRSKWMIVSAEQVEQTAKKLCEQAQTIKRLETTVKSHKRERLRIYDAAMKQVRAGGSFDQGNECLGHPASPQQMA